MYPNTEPFLKESKLHGIFKNISRVFCIFDNPKNKHKCVIYYMFFWVVSGILQIYAIWNRLFINKLHSVHSVTIIEMFFRVQIVLTNFLATWDLLFFKMDKIDKLNRVTELFKNSTKLHKEIAHSKRRFLILSVLILVSTTSAGLFNFIENIRSLGILIVIDFGPPVVLIIQTALLVTNICCKLHDIGMCLRILNREMCNTMMYSYTWIVIGNNHAKRQEFFGFLRAYNELFDTLVLANDVYSFHFLMLLLNVTTIILHISNMFIKYASGVLTINNGDVWKLTSIFSCIVLYVVSMYSNKFYRKRGVAFF